MTNIIVLASTKGGVGKTTATISIADYLSNKYSVAILNTDPSGSLTRWCEKGKENGFLEKLQFFEQIDDKKITLDVKMISNEIKPDFLIIDVAGLSSMSLLKACAVADLVIIPIQPSEDDFLEGINTRNTIIEAEAMIDSKIPYTALMTRVKPKNIVLDHTINQLSEENFPMLKNFMTERTVYQKARYTGNTPVSFDSTNLAKEEISLICEEILSKFFQEETVKLLEYQGNIKTRSAN